MIHIDKYNGKPWHGIGPESRKDGYCTWRCDEKKAWQYVEKINAERVIAITLENGTRSRSFIGKYSYDTESNGHHVYVEIVEPDYCEQIAENKDHQLRNKYVEANEEETSMRSKIMRKRRNK